MEVILSAAIMASLSAAAMQGVAHPPANHGASQATAPTGIVALRALPAGSVVTAEDVRLVGPGGHSDVDALAAIVGKETRRLIPVGATLNDRDVRAETLVQRNGVVRMEFTKGALSITAEGRALSSGAHGEIVKVMNLESRVTVSAVVIGRGKVAVQ